MSLIEKIRNLVDLSQDITSHDLAPYDHFHSLGVQATKSLADALEISAGAKILDVGCGIGGPARLIAERFNCKVLGVDQNAEYVEVGNYLSTQTGLSDCVTLQEADILSSSFEVAKFDGALMLHVTMNIAKRETLYQKIWNSLKPGGFLAITEHGLGEKSGILYPLPWAESESTSFLSPSEVSLACLKNMGFYEMSYHDLSAIYLRGYKRGLEKLRSDQNFLAGLELMMTKNAARKFQNTLINIEEKRLQPFQIICRKGEI